MICLYKSKYVIKLWIKTDSIHFFYRWIFELIAMHTCRACLTIVL